LVAVAGLLSATLVACATSREVRPAPVTVLPSSQVRFDRVRVFESANAVTVMGEVWRSAPGHTWGQGHVELSVTDRAGTVLREERVEEVPFPRKRVDAPVARFRFTLDELLPTSATIQLSYRDDRCPR